MFSVAGASLILPFLPMLPKQILLTNFLTDFPYLTVSSDNVDNEVLTKHGKWDLKLIRNYMVFFGIHSSIFDFITFFTLYYLLKVKESDFQTGWFIESVLSELCILFIIRTQKNFFKSKPGKYLFIFSIIAFILTIGLPYLPFAEDIGLTPLPLLNLGIMLLIVVFYIVTADLLKVWFFRKYNKV
jgi:Mg2+-importing ATPase